MRRAEKTINREIVFSKFPPGFHTDHRPQPIDPSPEILQVVSTARTEWGSLGRKEILWCKICTYGWSVE